jgi:hypothetical protein
LHGQGEGRASAMLFDYITLASLCDLSVGDIDSEWPHSQFISFLARSSSTLRSFSFGVPEEVSDMWDDNLIQIVQHMPSLHSLCVELNWCEVGLGSFLKRLLPGISRNGQVNCLIPKLNTISIQLGCQWIIPDYRALVEMVLSRCSLAHNTDADDDISDPIERIRKVHVQCCCDESFNRVTDTVWYEEVSEALAPLLDVVDTVQVDIF